MLALLLAGLQQHIVRRDVWRHLELVHALDEGEGAVELVLARACRERRGEGADLRHQPVPIAKAPAAVGKPRRVKSQGKNPSGRI